MNKVRLLPLCVLAVVCSASLLSGAYEEYDPKTLLPSTSDVVAYAKPAVVFIHHRDTAGVHSMGTGFLVHADGTVVTCAHVVEPRTESSAKTPKISDRIWARLYDGCVYEASRIYCDTDTDIALLSINVRGYPYLDLETSVPKLGEEAVLIGYPLGDMLGQESSVTRGIISSIRFSNTAYQFDAAVNPGNSGGPVLNKSGDVLGVLSFKVKGAERSGLRSRLLASTYRSVKGWFQADSAAAEPRGQCGLLPIRPVPG